MAIKIEKQTTDIVFFNDSDNVCVCVLVQANNYVRFFTIDKQKQ